MCVRPLPRAGALLLGARAARALRFPLRFRLAILLLLTKCGTGGYPSIGRGTVNFRQLRLVRLHKFLRRCANE